MSRRPITESPIPDFLDSEDEVQAREAIGAASQEELDALEASVAAIDIGEANSAISEAQADILAIQAELNTTIPPMRLMGNPGGTNVKPAPIDIDDGGLYINQSTGKIYVGVTELNGKVLYLSADRTDGKNGTGTLASPLNASTPARIDTIMQGLYNDKIPATLYFLPHPAIRMNMFRPHERFPVVPLPGGTYHPWYFYNGLRWRGFGKGRTVFKPAIDTNILADTTGTRLFFSTSMKVGVTNDIVYQGDIQDCSFDAEVTGIDVTAIPSSGAGATLAYRLGWNLYAGDMLIKNVEFKNMGGRGQEMFPFTLFNWPGGDYPDLPCNYVVEDCSTSNMWGTNGIGMAFHAAAGNQSRQRGLIQNNYFDDMYITWATFSNLIIQDNFLKNGVHTNGSAYGNCNYDTGISKNVKIIRNHMVDAIANGVCVGNIILGNWLSDYLNVELRDVLIKENTFESYPNIQPLWTPGVSLIGNVHNWNISDNFYKTTVHPSRFSKRGFVSTRGTGNAARPTTMDGGAAITDPNYGWGDAWNLTRPFSEGGPVEDGAAPWTRIPGGGPEQENSDGIMFNNKLIDFNTVESVDFPGVYYDTTPTADYGKTPLGMENKLMSALT